LAVPGHVVFDHLADPASSDGAFLAATHADAERGLNELQAILSEARLNEAAVAWLTWGAVAVLTVAHPPANAHTYADPHSDASAGQ